MLPLRNNEPDRCNLNFGSLVEQVAILSPRAGCSGRSLKRPPLHRRPSPCNVPVQCSPRNRYESLSNKIRIIPLLSFFFSFSKIFSLSESVATNLSLIIFLKNLRRVSPEVNRFEYLKKEEGEREREREELSSNREKQILRVEQFHFFQSGDPLLSRNKKKKRKKGKERNASVYINFQQEFRARFFFQAKSCFVHAPDGNNFVSIQSGQPAIAPRYNIQGRATKRYTQLVLKNVSSI